MPMCGATAKGGVHRVRSSTASDQATLAAGRLEGRRARSGSTPAGPVADSGLQLRRLPRHPGGGLHQPQRPLPAAQPVAGRPPHASYDLRFVTHTGDVVNWDTGDHAQYEMARDGTLAPLEQPGIPYSLVTGTTTTAAVCPGGGACDPPEPRLPRDTRTFNPTSTASR